VTCDAVDDCPSGAYACGNDGFCHAPGGQLAEPSAPVTFQADDLRITDLDRDGAGDVIGVSKTSIIVRKGDAAGTLAATTSFVTPAQSGPPAFGDLDGDGTIDVTLATPDGIALLTSRFGTLSPVAIESPIFDEQGQPLDFLRLFQVSPVELGGVIFSEGAVQLVVVTLVGENPTLSVALPCGLRLDNLGEMQRELDKLEAPGKAGKIKSEVIGERTRIGVNVAKGDQTAPDTNALREIGEGTGTALVGVTITLDGKPLEPFALVDVEPGEHVIAAAADGYFSIEKKQRAVQGATALVEVALVPKPARVKVSTESGAKITVDGRPVLTTMLELATGKHVITVTHRGRVPQAREVIVTRGQELTIDAALEKTTRRRAAPWVLGGAGALAVLSGIAGIAAVVADGNAIDARDQIAGGNASIALGDAYDRHVESRNERKTTAIMFGAGALVAAAVGLGLYLFDPPPPSRIEKLELAPVLGRGTAGVTASRRF